jgi:vacuolar-type H+-ATPase catalytic subunit A/Vma1
LLNFYFSIAKEIFDKIQKPLEVYTKENKLTFIKKFFEYHSKIIFKKNEYNTTIIEKNEDFIISLEELKNL